MIPEFVRYLTLKHTERFNFLFSVVSLRGGLIEEYLFIQKGYPQNEDNLSVVYPLGKKRKIPRLSLFRASGGFPKYIRGSVLFLDIYQFYFKDQSRERFDFTSFLCTVSQFLRNI